MRRIAPAVGLAAVLTLGCGRTPADEIPPAAPWQPRPLTDVVFDATPERRAAGEYLVQGVLQCFVCHSERDWSKPGAPPVEGRAGAGAVWWDRAWLVAPNLTPDPETGIGRWTDDMLARAIREGVGHDGRVLDPQMWSASFRYLTDEEVASVIVYLRSRAPVRNRLPPTTRPADVPAPDPPAPRSGAPLAFVPGLERGGRLVALADCAGCHTSWHTPRNPGIFGGGNLIEGKGGRAFSANLTSAPSGIPYYDAALFREVLRTGRVKGRALSPVMPWTAFRHLDDADLDAIFAYLSAYRPADHALDNVNRPTACPVCGGTHPLGEYNRLHPVDAVPYAASDWPDAAGTYRLADDLLITIGRRGARLTMGLNDEAPCDLIDTGGGRFVCEDAGARLDEIQFARTDGRVTHLVDNRTDVARRAR